VGDRDTSGTEVEATTKKKNKKPGTAAKKETSQNEGGEMAGGRKTVSRNRLQDGHLDTSPVRVSQKPILPSIART